MKVDDDFRFDLWILMQMKEKNMTMADVARKSGITKEAVRHLVTGDRNPTLYTFTHIVRAFGTFVDIPGMETTTK